MTKKDQVYKKIQKELDNEKEQGYSAYLNNAKEIASKINVRNSGYHKNYNFQTIQQVFEQTIELAKDEFVKLTLESRKERRKLMESDVNTYVKLIIDYNDEIEIIIKKAQIIILDILGITYNDFEEQVIYFMEKGYYQEVYKIQSAMRQKLRGYVKSTKDLTFDIIKQIIQFQIQKLQQNSELIKKILQKISQTNETSQLIPMILTEFLNDYIYNQYGVEQEDQIMIMKEQDISNDCDIIILNQELEQSLNSLLDQINLNMESVQEYS